MVRQLVMALPIAALVAGGSTACATKGFVRTSVGEVNSKVDSLGRSVEETQERTRQNEGRIAEVDQKAGAAAQAASAANSAAATANTAATAAGAKADTANTKVEVLDKAARRLVYEVVLSEDNGNFKFANTELPDEAKAKLKEVFGACKGCHDSFRKPEEKKS